MPSLSRNLSAYPKVFTLDVTNNQISLANSLIFADGTRQNTAAAGQTITNDAASATARYVLLTTQTSGTLSVANTSADGLYYTPSTGTFSANNFNSLSDERFKENIQNIDDADFVIKNIRGVSFNWKNSGKKSYGVIAQELEVILPELIETNEAGTKTVNYNALIPFLVEAIKKQQKEIDDLKKQLLP